MGRIYTYIIVAMILAGIGFTDTTTNLLGDIGSYLLNGFIIILLLVWSMILGANFLNKIFDRFFPAKY